MLRAADESGQQKPLRWSPFWLMVAASCAASCVIAAVVYSGASGRPSPGMAGAPRSIAVQNASGATTGTTGQRSTMSSTFFSIPGLADSSPSSPAATQPSTTPGPAQASVPPWPTISPTARLSQTATSGDPAPDGVPAAEAGAMVQNLSGQDILRTYHQGVMAGADCSSPPLRLDTAMGVDLHTDGQNECAALSSPVTYGTGIFEARIWFDGGGQDSIANWPAFYMVGNPWPDAGEIDAAEGMDGCLQVTYHFGTVQDPQQDGPHCVTSVPGWHVVTIVRTSGDAQTGPVDSVYYDGHEVWTGSGYVVSSPEYIVVSNNEGQYGRQPGEPADLWINYIRVWNLKT